jgi:hypothetical protein
VTRSRIAGAARDSHPRRIETSQNQFLTLNSGASLLRRGAKNRMRRCCISQAWAAHREVLAIACFGFGGIGAGAGAVEADLKTLIPMWEPSFSLRMRGGYKDNVALAHAGRDSSPFVSATLEAFAQRLPLDGTRVQLFLSAEETRYFSTRTVDHEDFLQGHGEVRHYWENDWQAAFSLEGFHLDQVIDFSITDTNREAIPVRGGGFTGRPGVRRELSKAVWLAVELPAARQMYEGAVVDDFWEIGPKATLGRTYGNQSEVSASYVFTHRGYDRMRAREADGTEITNQVRSAAQHDVILSWKHHWDARRRWRNTTRVSYRHTADNANGYFDYERVAVSEQFRFRTEHWEVGAEARVAEYRFPVQRVGGTGTSKRNRVDLTLSLRAERRLTRHLALFAEYEHDQTFSNLTLDEYAVNTVGGGINLEF